MTVIVAGITRSGLSLMMQMLHAGGYPCEGDPPAFEPHPVGLIPWKSCVGKAVKLVDAHLHLPPDGYYHVIRLVRDLREQARSFNKWTTAFGIPPTNISKLINSFREDYKAIDEWAEKQQSLLTLKFEDLIEIPRISAQTLRNWLNVPMDIDSMSNVVVNRDASCYPELLESWLIRRRKFPASG